MKAVPGTALQIRSLLKTNGELELSLADFEVPQAADGEVLVRVDAAPINPSDQALLFAGSNLDLNTLRATGSASRPVVTAQVPTGGLRNMATRLGRSLPIGNEGCGVVVDAGHSPAAQALLGKTVAVIGGSMYSQYRAVPVEMCLVLPDGTKPADGASSFINPLTALGMVETMISSRNGPACEEVTNGINARFGAGRTIAVPASILRERPRAPRGARPTLLSAASTCSYATQRATRTTGRWPASRTISSARSSRTTSSRTTGSCRWWRRRCWSAATARSSSCRRSAARAPSTGEGMRFMTNRR